MSDESARVRLGGLKILSDSHYILRRAEFDYRRSDGRWQSQARESYDIGDGAAVLPRDRARGLVLLIRQFRWPAFEWGHKAPLVEAIAGKLDGDDPETCAVKEAREEAGAAVTGLKLVSHCFMSPGAVKERLSLFLADYDSTAPRGAGSSRETEGEDIAVLELPLEDALAMAERGGIVDAKTILLLQAARLAQ